MAIGKDLTKKIKFTKYQGLGNDFILVDNRHQAEPCLTPEQAIQLCDRRWCDLYSTRIGGGRLHHANF
jgi:hypothetical protein